MITITAYGESEIKSGDYRTLEYTLTPTDYYIRYEQPFVAIIPPAVATYKDVDGNLYRAASKSVYIDFQVADSDGDGWSDTKEIIMGTNPFSDDSDSDGLKDPEDPNPKSLEAVWLLGGLALLTVIMCVTFILIYNRHVQHGYTYKAILEDIFAFLIVISGPILIVGGIILYIGNRSGAFPTFPFAGFITMLLGWLILFLILCMGDN